MTVLPSFDNVLLVEPSMDTDNEAVPFSADSEEVGERIGDLVTVAEAISRDMVSLNVVEYVDEPLSESVIVRVGESSSDMVAVFVGNRVTVVLGDLDRDAFVFSHELLTELLDEAVWLAFGVLDAEKLT